MPGKMKIRCLQAIKADCRRLNQYARGADAPEPSRLRYLSLALRPEILPLLLYRFSHRAHERRRYGWARFFYRINLFLTGADIHPASEIGPGALMVHSVGSVIAAHIGSNATLFAMVVIEPAWFGADLSSAPTLGDNVTVYTAATILGRITIADDVTIGPYSLVEQSIEDAGSLFSLVPGKHTVSVIKRKTE